MITVATRFRHPQILLIELKEQSHHNLQIAFNKSGSLFACVTTLMTYVWSVSESDRSLKLEIMSPDVPNKGGYTQLRFDNPNNLCLSATNSMEDDEHPSSSSDNNQESLDRRFRYQTRLHRLQVTDKPESVEETTNWNPLLLPFKEDIIWSPHDGRRISAITSLKFNVDRTKVICKSHNRDPPAYSQVPSIHGPIYTCSLQIYIFRHGLERLEHWQSLPLETCSNLDIGECDWHPSGVTLSGCSGSGSSFQMGARSGYTVPYFHFHPQVFSQGH